MKTKSFFGENGITSTSANHYANLAKEANRNNQNYLANIQFYSTGIRVIGQIESGIIHEGVNADELQKICDTIKRIGELNSLCAFFREAIKEKEKLAEEAKKWEDSEERDKFGKMREELEKRKPVRGSYLTEEDVKASWTIGEQEKYLSLEAEAAAIGKYIHEDGFISKARIDLFEKKSNPMDVKENGRDTIIYDYTPTVTTDEVDSMFFSLQKRHREVQAELNGMKLRIINAIDEHKRKIDEEYRLALVQWNNEVGKLSRDLQEFMEEESKVRMSRQQNIADLKIVVPNRLKDVFESLKK